MSPHQKLQGQEQDSKTRPPPPPTISTTQSSRSYDERRLLREKLKKQSLWGRRWTLFMAGGWKNHVVAMIGEFIGTFLFLFFSFAGVGVAKTSLPTPDATLSIGALLFIAIAFGFSLLVNVWAFYRISGGLFNPSVTLALTLLRAITPLRGLLLFLTQLVAAIWASYIVSIVFPTPFAVTTTLSPGVSIAQGLFIEVFCTAELVFVIIMLAVEKHRATWVAPVGIGLAFLLAELISVYYTGGSLNPARSLGPSTVTGSFSSDDWIYWVGPALGSLLAVGVFKALKFLEYEMANPGQDGDYENDPTKNKMHALARRNSDRGAEVSEIRAVRLGGGRWELDGEEVDVHEIVIQDHDGDLESGMGNNTARAPVVILPGNSGGTSGYVDNDADSGIRGINGVNGSGGRI